MKYSMHEIPQNDRSIFFVCFVSRDLCSCIYEFTFCSIKAPELSLSMTAAFFRSRFKGKMKHQKVNFQSHFFSHPIFDEKKRDHFNDKYFGVKGGG